MLVLRVVNKTRLKAWGGAHTDAKTGGTTGVAWLLPVGWDRAGSRRSYARYDNN